MAFPIDRNSSDPKQPPVPTITSQVQEGLPSLAEAQQLEELLGAKPSLWRRLQDFSGSSQLRVVLQRKLFGAEEAQPERRHRECQG